MAELEAAVDEPLWSPFERLTQSAKPSAGPISPAPQELLPYSFYCWSRAALLICSSDFAFFGATTAAVVPRSL